MVDTVNFMLRIFNHDKKMKRKRKQASHSYVVGKGGSILIPFQITMDIQSTEPKLNKWFLKS